jgi:hypothetical protein
MGEGVIKLFAEKIATLFFRDRQGEFLHGGEHVFPKFAFFGVSRGEQERWCIAGAKIDAIPRMPSSA